MIRLYQSSTLQPGHTIELDKNPSHHLCRVLRAKKGAELILFNGDGHEYLAELLDDNPKKSQLKIKHKNSVNNESSLNITLLQGASRGDRMDSCIQKSIELGAHSIIPVICQRTGINLKGNRAEKKQNHWQQIVISACEQSGRCIIPEVSPVVDFAQAVKNTQIKDKFILAPDAATSIRNIPSPGSEICILIGPEGGFTSNEIKLATDNGFTSISLGPRILRTETAGPACIAIAQTLWGDLG